MMPVISFDDIKRVVSDSQVKAGQLPFMCLHFIGALVYFIQHATGLRMVRSM